MILLDTDHLSVFMDERDPRDGPLNGPMEAAADSVAIGTTDLKIASIALVKHALLVSANARDYSVAPDLRCEN
jgi:hypothetical protein